MRTEATYGAVMSSPLMTDELRQAYYVLWTPTLRGQPVDGLTKAEVAYNAEVLGWAKNPAAPLVKMVPLLGKMKLAKRGNKRHCTVTNKEDVVWSLTEESTPVKIVASKPPAKQYVKAVAQLESLIAHHISAGDGLITPELHKLYEWVRDKVPVQK